MNLCRVTTHLEKSGNSTLVREMEKSGSEIRCVFSSSKYARSRFSAGALSLDSTGGAYNPIPFPQLLQPQLLNN